MYGGSEQLLHSFFLSQPCAKDPSFVFFYYKLKKTWLIFVFHRLNMYYESAHSKLYTYFRGNKPLFSKTFQLCQ